MTWLPLIIAALLIANFIAILFAGARGVLRHRAEKKYWREYDQRNGT